MYCSLYSAFFFSCWYVVLSDSPSLVQHAFIFFSLVPLKAVEDGVAVLGDDVFGAIYGILLFLWALSSFAIHVSKLCVVFLFFYRKYLVLGHSVPSPVFLFFLYPLRMTWTVMVLVA